MSACDFSNKEMRSYLKNSVEDLAPQDAIVKHSKDSTTIQFKAITEAELEKMKEDVMNKNNDWNQLNHEGDFKDFIEFNYDANSKIATFKYKFLEFLTMIINKFNRSNREARKQREELEKLSKINKQLDEYHANVAKTEQVVSEKNADEFFKENNEVLKESEKVLNESVNERGTMSRTLKAEPVTFIVSEQSLQDVQEQPSYPPTQQEIDNNPKRPIPKGLEGTLFDTRPKFDETTDIDTYHSLVKARTQYSRHVKNFMWEMQREIDRLEHMVEQGTTEENGVKLIRAKELHDRFKLLWMTGTKVDNMHANEFMDTLLNEMKILESHILSGHNIPMLFKRVNFLKMLLNGETIDGATMDFNLKHVNDKALYAIRKQFADLENNFINLANAEVIKHLMSSDVFRKNISAMGITDVSQIAKLITAKGDLGTLEQMFKGISFSDQDVGIMPEMMKVMFHKVNVKHLAEAEKQKQRLAEAAKKVGKDTEFAKERDKNGNLTGELIQPFRSVWTKILSRAGNAIEKKKIYAEYAEKIDYSKIPHIKAKYGGAFAEHFVHSEETMKEYDQYLRNRLGKAYDKVMANADKKLQEFLRISLIEEDTTQFSPFLEHQGTNETFYMEFIPKHEEYINRDYDKLTDDQRNYVETIISINKSYISANLEEHGHTSYGKFFLGMLDAAGRQKKIDGKAKKILRHALKLFYINRDAIVGTKVDDKYVDDIKMFKDTVFRRFNNMDLVDVIKYAQDFGIKVPTSNTTVAEVADLIANALYKADLEEDLTSVTEKMIDIASSSATRNEMLPVAQNMYRYFKIHNYGKAGIEKTMRSFIDIVIRGLRPKDLSVFEKILGSKVKLEDINTLEDVRKIVLTKRDMTENDKIILDLIRKGSEVDTSRVQVNFADKDGNTYYNNPKTGEFFRNSVPISRKEFDTFYAKKLAYDLNKTGIPLTVGSVFRGINTLILHKYLGLSPVAGIINRWQGMNDNGLADATGHYWTTGNLAKAQRFLNLTNLINYGDSTLTPKKALAFMNRIMPKKKIEEMKKLQKLTKILGMNIYKEDGQTSGLSDMLMSWSIKDPEFKNQMEIFLSIMQDMKIKDINGNEHQMFDGEQLTAYELVDGKLMLKDEFRTDDNIAMYENFVEGSTGENPIAEFVAKHQKALSHIQNNFDNNDTTTTANNLLLSTFAMLKKWIVSGFMQRFDSGQGRDITFNKKKKEGRYITGMRRKGAGASFVAGNMALALGLGAGVGTLGIMGAGMGMIYLGYKMYMKKKFNQDIKTNALNVQELVIFWKSALLSAIDFPARTIGGRSFGFKNENVGSGDLTPEEVGNIKALGMELGNKIALLAMSLAVLAMLHDDDDDEDSKKRRLYNYLANRLSGLVYDNAIYLNPSEMVNSVSRVGIIDFSKNLFETTTLIFNGDEVTDERKERLYTKVSLIPNTINNMIFRGGNPFSSDQDMSSDVFKSAMQSEDVAAKKKKRVKMSNFTDKAKGRGYGDEEIKLLKRWYLPKKAKNESEEAHLNRVIRATADIDWDKVIDKYPPKGR